MTEDVKRTIRIRGAIKIVAGLVMMPLTFLVILVGFLAKLIGGLALLAAIATKIAAVYVPEDERKAFWNERTQKLAPFGGITFISGLILTIPFLPGVLLMFEGVYNVVAVEASCGILQTLNALSNFISNLVSGTEKKQKATEFTEVVKEDKPAKKKPAQKTASKS